MLLFALRKKLGKLEMELPRQNLLWLLAMRDLWPGSSRMKAGGCGKTHSATDHRTENRGGVRAGGNRGLVYWLAALAFKIPAAKEMMEFALAKFKRKN